MLDKFVREEFLGAASIIIDKLVDEIAEEIKEELKDAYIGQFLLINKMKWEEGSGIIEDPILPRIRTVINKTLYFPCEITCENISDMYRPVLSNENTEIFGTFVTEKIIICGCSSLEAIFMGTSTGNQIIEGHAAMGGAIDSVIPEELSQQNADRMLMKIFAQLMSTIPAEVV